MPVARGESIDPLATQAKVLDAAAVLFAANGVNAVSVNQIAARANASKLSLYRYFGSKDGLVETLVRNRSARTIQRMRGRLEKIPDGIDQVGAVFDTLIELYSEDGFTGCPVVNSALETRGSNDITRDVARAHLAAYRALFEEILTAQGVRAPAAVARQLVVLVEGATMVSAVDSHAQAARDARTVAVALVAAALPE
jgi:AcrR family transcriptional regulator